MAERVRADEPDRLGTEPTGLIGVTGERSGQLLPGIDSEQAVRLDPATQPEQLRHVEDRLEAGRRDVGDQEMDGGGADVDGGRPARLAHAPSAGGSSRSASGVGSSATEIGASFALSASCAPAASAGSVAATGSAESAS